MTTAEELTKYVKKTLHDKQIIIAVQSEPYMHIHTPKGIVAQENAGGAHVLLDGILKQTGGSIVAVARGDADAEVIDEQGRVKVPPGKKSYTLKRIFLTKKELDGFYYGFANQTLWPLCHNVYVKPIFSDKWWDEYQKVNEKFAEAITAEDDLDPADAFIWINDYHLTLLPKLLKERNPKVSIGFFWHIPWPTYEIFRICPWRKQILEGMLGADFIGFHRGFHVDNFINCARRELEVLVDTEPRSITYKDHVTKLTNLPAGIDYNEIREVKDFWGSDNNLFKKDFGFQSQYVALGVDRVDYTKGIPERLMIIDRFLEKYPEFQGKFVYLSIGAPSRVHIPAYKALNKEINQLIRKINKKYHTKSWKPIYFHNKIVTREKVFRYYSLADVCLVTSLDDGMNLVAKEYVIRAKPEKGMLVLSRFTGASKDLQEAIQINPYHIEQSADALYQALTMPKEERVRRMNSMKNAVKEYNIYQWGIKFIKNTIEPTPPKYG